MQSDYRLRDFIQLPAVFAVGCYGVLEDRILPAAIVIVIMAAIFVAREVADYYKFKSENHDGAE